MNLNFLVGNSNFFAKSSVFEEGSNGNDRNAWSR